MPLSENEFALCVWFIFSLSSFFPFVYCSETASKNFVGLLLRMRIGRNFKHTKPARCEYVWKRTQTYHWTLMHCQISGTNENIGAFNRNEAHSASLFHASCYLVIFHSLYATDYSSARRCNIKFKEHSAKHRNRMQ